MSPSLRASSPAPSRPRPRHPSKTSPAFHLGSLPRFHPAVYQSSNPSNLQPSSPSMQQRSSQQYRTTNPREALRHYRELVAGMTMTPRGATSAPLTKPTKPRLDPMGSPGPVTPLALEDQDDGYFAAGLMHSENRALNEQPPSKEALDRMLQRERERIISNASRKEVNGR